VNYNQSLYRTGFRPYGHTDAFAASQLGDLGQSHPFGPWMLHGDGLGQNHPFTERGGWALHGLDGFDYYYANQDPSVGPVVAGNPVAIAASKAIAAESPVTQKLYDQAVSDWSAMDAANAPDSTTSMPWWAWVGIGIAGVMALKHL
jgi:hypothetical protein